MLLRNTIVKRSLLTRTGVSTGTTAKLYINQSLPFNRFVHYKTPGFIPFRRLAINHAMNPNLRRIHNSSLRSATPLYNIPEPSQLASEETPSQKQLVYQEINALWSHPLHLFKEEKNFDMAIALLRSRLKDPYAHLSSPANGSIDELRVLGYYYLALVLQAVVHRDRLFGMPEDDELLDALRRARDGLMRYAYDKGTQASALEMLAINLARRDETVEALQVHSQLVEILKDLNEEDPTRIDPTMMSGREREATPLDRLDTALQSLATFYSEVFQQRKAVEIMDEACEVLEELEGAGMTNPGRYAYALCMRAHFMVEAGMEGSNVLAKQAASKIDEMVELVAENSEYAVEEVLDSVAETAVVWVLIVSLLEKILSDEEWREVYGGKSRREVLTLAKERGIRLSNIPSNHRDGLPGDWEKPLALSYYAPLIALSSKSDSVMEEVAVLEKAVEVHLIQAPLEVPEFLRLPNHLPEDLPYSEFIKLFNWDEFTYSNESYFIIFLPQVGVARLKLLKQLETESKDGRNTDAYNACTSIMAQEIEYGLKAADKYSESPLTQEAKKAMEVAKGELLILKGRMIARQTDGRQEARQYWEDAKNAFIGVEGLQTNGLDMVEKKRLDGLKLVEDLLSGGVEI